MSDDAVFTFIKTPLTGAQDVLIHWRERLLYYLLRGAVVAGFFALLASIVVDIQIHDWTDIIVTCVVYAILVVITFVRMPYRLRASVLVALLYLLMLNSLLDSGIRGDTFMFAIAFSVLTLMLLGIRAGWIAMGLTATTILFVGWLVVTQQIGLKQLFDQESFSVWLSPTFVQVLVDVLLYVGVILLQREFMAALGREKNAMDAVLQEREQLEQRVSERTRELSLAADVGRNVSQLHDLDTLLPKAVELIRTRFDLYYAQIYLADASGKTLTLRAGTGEVGADLLRRSHRLPVGAGSINGIAASEHKAMIVADTATSQIFKPNPLLPDTRSEMSVPLMVGERVVGVLDLQSKEPGALSSENLTVFQTLAGQLAIALDNATLFAQTEQSRQEVEEQSRRLTLSGWQEFLNALDRSERIGYSFDQNNLTSFNEPLPEAQVENTVKTSIVVTGASIGTVQLEREADEPWMSEDIELVNSVVDQAARQIENLRLLAQSETYRNEAEMSARRLTREGWSEYMQTKAERSGYVYDHTDVQPLESDGTDHRDGTEQPLSTEQAAVAAAGQPENAVFQPLKVGGAMVGELAFDGVDALDAESNQLVSSVADLLSSHIEELRLTEQTQKALIDTEQLYSSSAELNTARTYDEILSVLRRHTVAGESSQAVTLSLFNRPWAGEDMPEYVETVAAWNAQGQEGMLIRMPLAMFPAARVTLHADMPTVFEDVMTDDRLHENARAVLMKTYGSRAAIFIPLVAGGQWIGYTVAGYSQSRKFPAEVVRRLVALSGQAAVAVNNLRLLDETQSLAQREKNLRQITALVRGSTNADTILRTATRELGTVLGRKVKVQLGGAPKKGAASSEEQTSGSVQPTRKA